MPTHGENQRFVQDRHGFIPKSGRRSKQALWHFGLEQSTAGTPRQRTGNDAPTAELAQGCSRLPLARLAGGKTGYWPPSALPTSMRKDLAAKLSNRVLTELGRLGGRQRTKKLTPEQRREIARKAARARWGPRKPGAP